MMNTMKNKISIIFASVFLGAILMSFTSLNTNDKAENNNIYGLWWNAEKTGKIKVYKAKSGKVCGKIVWLKEPKNDQGNPKLDKKNPNEELAKKPIINLVILKHLVYQGKNKWEDGKIYDPNNGKTYSCEMTLSSDNKKLDIRGYVGISLIGRTSTWTKIE